MHKNCASSWRGLSQCNESECHSREAHRVGLRGSSRGRYLWPGLSTLECVTGRSPSHVISFRIAVLILMMLSIFIISSLSLCGSAWNKQVYTPGTQEKCNSKMNDRLASWLSCVVWRRVTYLPAKWRRGHLQWNHSFCNLNTAYFWKQQKYPHPNETKSNYQTNCKLSTLIPFY